MLIDQVLSCVHSWPQRSGEGFAPPLRMGWAGFLKANQDPHAKRGNKNYRGSDELNNLPKATELSVVQ